MGIAGDWGTGTPTAYRVGSQIASHSPDITIHLGDVYYSGTAQEFHDYFLDAWPRGTLQTFALNANHEMYSGGEGYFACALATLDQQASYFCLENDHWRILGLDTGYYARSVPFLELLMKGWIRLHSTIRTWLAEVVFADAKDRRPVIVLTHHQWFSAFDTEYRQVGSNLRPYLDRVALWLWAHEHRFAGYGPFGFNGIKVRARCLGHGGMPIELGKRPERDRNLLFVDQRQASDPNGQPLELMGKPIGYSGYAILKFTGPTLCIEYRDENRTLLLEECWTCGPDGPRVRILTWNGLTPATPPPEF